MKVGKIINCVNCKKEIKISGLVNCIKCPYCKKEFNLKEKEV